MISPPNFLICLEIFRPVGSSESPTIFLLAMGPKVFKRHNLSTLYIESLFERYGLSVNSRLLAVFSTMKVVFWTIFFVRCSRLEILF